MLFFRALSFLFFNFLPFHNESILVYVNLLEIFFPYYTQFKPNELPKPNKRKHFWCLFLLSESFIREEGNIDMKIIKVLKRRFFAKWFSRRSFLKQYLAKILFWIKLNEKKYHAVIQFSTLSPNDFPFVISTCKKEIISER